jgi:Asp-tRNA(Asn)/Glu-tRNA(Gln) amidotransferase A subunit family amidase
MIVGDHFDERTVVSVADAFERSTDWRERSY